MSVAKITTLDHVPLRSDTFFKRVKKNFKSRPALYFMVLPGVIWFALLCYYPMYGILMAFQDTDFGLGILGSPWVGFKHFVEFFQGPYAFRIIRNTVLLNVYSLLWGFPMPIILALLLNEIVNLKFKGIIQTISYLPYFISTVVLVGMVVNFLSMNGTVNMLLKSMGLEPILFIQEPGLFRTIYVASGVWQGVGWGTIIYLAAISGVNIELYESAVIDGANRWHQTIYITIPSILPTIMILLILSISTLMASGFEKVYLLYSPATYETADVIATYVYREGLVSMNYSYSTAVGLFQSVTNLFLLISANTFSRKYSEFSLW